LVDSTTLIASDVTPGRATATLGSDRSVSRTRRRQFGPADPAAVRIAVGIGSGLVVAEAVTLTLGPTAGVLAHAFALVVLAGLSMRLPRGANQRLTLSAGLIPIVRILSIAVPAAIIPPIYWYLEIGLAGLEGILLLMRRLDLAPRDVGLRRTPLAEVVSVGLIGAILGIPAYLIAGRLELGYGAGPVALVIASAVVMIFVGFFEELLFRGLIQSAGTQLFSRGGVLISVAATALMYSASLNPRYVVFATFVAAFFGVVARRSGSIAAPVAGHAALALVQLVVLPIVLS
jgi:membrane protease YdiL (CAAX protease family)